MLKALQKLLPYRDIGWKDIDEEFTRFTVLKTRWFNVYLHRLNAPQWHPECHDHPWSFWTIILWNGYLEQVGAKLYRRRAGSVHYRPAEFSHNVVTPYGTAWSLIFTTRKTRQWGFQSCPI